MIDEQPARRERRVGRGGSLQSSSRTHFAELDFSPRYHCFERGEIDLKIAGIEGEVCRRRSGRAVPERQAARRTASRRPVAARRSSRSVRACPDRHWSRP